MLVQQLQDVIDDLVLGFGEEHDSGKAVSGIRARGFFRRSSSMMVWRSCLVQKPFCSSSSTIAAISHMLEMAASPVDMVSRFRRCSVMLLSLCMHIVGGWAASNSSNFPKAAQ